MKTIENEINKHVVQPTTSSDYTLYSDVCTITEHGRQQTCTADNQSMIETNRHIGRPIVAEFSGFKQENTFSEEKLTTAIINHLQEFPMELGRGFAFMGQQRLVRTDTQDHCIDLVFYNVVLKCYVSIDLKTETITHQDVGETYMYVRMYDELNRTEGDNPTIGIVLCSETSKDIARCSILKGNEQLFAAKYKTYLPTEEQPRTEIERQKELYKLQHNK